MKTLDNTYCKPNIEEWEKITALLKSIEKYYWRKYDNDGNCFLHDDTVYLSNGTIGDWNTRTEIPVQHFIDLMEDKIVAWRLVEDGFVFIKDHTPFYEMRLSKVSCLSWSESTKKHGVALEIREEQIWFSITKYTDLLTLIRFVK